MKSYIIGKKDDGARLSRFVEAVAPSLPPSMLYKAIRLRRIKVNGKRCDAALRLAEGDRVELYINDEFFANPADKAAFLAATPSLSIVYEDDNIAFLNKPAGLLVHSDDGGENDTLINRFLKYLYEKKEYDYSLDGAFTPALCNRLDRGTFGIVIAAKNREALSEMNGIIKNREVEKYYLAAAIGSRTLSGERTAYLFKDEKSNTVSVSDTQRAGYREIRTCFSLLSRSEELSLYEVRLITGRTHQIRAHMAHLGAHVLGDGKYGRGEQNRRYNVTRQALCAYRIAFRLKGDYPTLAYLDGREYKIDEVWFTEYFA